MAANDIGAARAVAPSNNKLNGKTAVITGAAAGIGRGIARRMAAEGANIVIADINTDAMKSLVAELTRDFAAHATYVQTDVRERDQVLRMITKADDLFGGTDILVNNAWGGGTTCRLEHKTDAMISHGLQVGLWPSFWAMQAVFPYMKGKRWGRIINICSLNGVNAHMYSAEYNIAKEGLRTLTRTAAREWAHHGITANVICPSAASTAYEEFRRKNPANAEAITQTIPMKRIGDPEWDIGPVATFLASDDSRYLTGNTLFADGGGHINGVPWAPELPE